MVRNKKLPSDLTKLWAAIVLDILKKILQKEVLMQKIALPVLKFWRSILFQFASISLIGMLFLSGCNSEPPVIVGDVEIVVTFSGDAVKQGNVNLAGIGRAEGGTAKLNETGTVLIKGIRIGKYKVYVSPPQLQAPVPDLAKGGFKPAPVPDDIPTLFHTELTSPLTIEVKEGENKFTFDLKELNAGKK